MGVWGRGGARWERKLGVEREGVKCGLVRIE